MNMLADFVKIALVPGSLAFLLIGLAAGVILLHAGRRAERCGRRWLTTLAALYLVLSLPLTSVLLERSLSGGYVRAEADAGIPEDAGAVVILGGGGLTLQTGGLSTDLLSDASVLRTLEGARLFFELDPAWVIVSGGPSPGAGLTAPESEAMRSLLLELGVPDGRILVEGASGDTHDQALNLRPMLAARDVTDFALVTSATHMPRAMRSFQAAGLYPIPAPAPEGSETQPEPFPLLPNLRALDASRNALREWMGLAYYALRGWL